MNRIYLIIGIISLLLIGVHICVKPDSWVSNISAIGDSGICAIIIAYIIDGWQKRERDKKVVSLLSPYTNELVCVLERILWLDQHLEDDDFDWSLKPIEYWRLEFTLKVGDKVFLEPINGSKVSEYIKGVIAKYNDDSIQKMPRRVRNRVNKLFKIVAAGSPKLLALQNELLHNRIMLCNGGILTVSKCNQIQEELQLIYKSMLNERGVVKNYGVIVNSIISTLDALGNNPIPKHGITPCLYSPECSIAI